MTGNDQFSIRPAGPADLDAARGVFAAYPFKTAQRLGQGLDAGRLVDFYSAGLKQALEKGWPHWVAERAGELIALVGLVDDRWHSGVYGMNMGKVSPWLNAQAPAGETRGAIGRALLGAVEQRAAGNYEHLSVRLDGEDFENLHLFESDGWLLVDVSLKFSRPLPVTERKFAMPAGGWTVGQATAEDMTWVRRLGSTTHGGTHFLNDPALPREKTEELFARWLGLCFDRLAYRIYVLRDGEGRGRGFVTYLRNQGFARAVGRAPLILDFVLLDPVVRGGGLGPWFVEETMALETGNGFDYCELRTPAHNLPAVMMYEKVGFRCVATDFVLHKRLS